jgi:hypothetical protein
MLSRRYWGKKFPEYSDIVAATRKACTEAVEKASQGPPTLEEAEQVQQCLTVACQVMIPPMRGKPFWTLQLVDKKDNSVDTLPFPSMVHVIMSVHRCPCEER